MIKYLSYLNVFMLMDFFINFFNFKQSFKHCLLINGMIWIGVVIYILEIQSNRYKLNNTKKTITFEAFHKLHNVQFYWIESLNK